VYRPGSISGLRRPLKDNWQMIQGLLRFKIHTEAEP
jgi:hypothetical protein